MSYNPSLNVFNHRKYEKKARPCPCVHRLFVCFPLTLLTFDPSSCSPIIPPHASFCVSSLLAYLFYLILLSHLEIEGSLLRLFFFFLFIIHVLFYYPIICSIYQTRTSFVSFHPNPIPIKRIIVFLFLFFFLLTLYLLTFQLLFFPSPPPSCLNLIVIYLYIPHLCIYKNGSRLVLEAKKKMFYMKLFISSRIFFLFFFA